MCVVMLKDRSTEALFHLKDVDFFSEIALSVVIYLYQQLILKKVELLNITRWLGGVN